MDVTAHPLLSEESKALDGPTLEAHSTLAQEVLGFTGMTFQGAKLDTAKTAVALQVNRQVQKALEPDSMLASSVSRGARSKAYADAARKVLDPTAAALAHQVVGPGRYAPVVRTTR